MAIEEFLSTIVPIIGSNIATIIGCVVIIFKTIKKIQNSTDENTREVRKQNKLLSNRCLELQKENIELRRMITMEQHKRLGIKEVKKDDLHEKN